MPFNQIYDGQFEQNLPAIDLTKSTILQGDLYLPEPLYAPDESRTSGVAVGESDYDTPIDERSVTDAEFINRQRAFKQPEYVKGVNAIVGGVVSGLATAVQDVAYLADVDNAVGRLMGTQEVADNWLSSAMKDFKQGLEEFAPIYREDPNKVWDWGDSGSYWSALKGVIDSAVGFGIPGMGAMKLTTAAMKGLRTTALLNGMLTANRADAIASIGAGFMTNFAEGTTMAVEAFENSMNAMKQNHYNNILKKYIGQGLEIGEASQLANKEFEESLAAGKEKEFEKIAGKHADRFQRNNMVFMLTDAIGLSGLFKASKGLTRNLITKESAKNYFLGANADNFFVQGIKEGAEEIGQNVLQSEAEYQSARDAKVPTLEPEDALERVIGFATSDKALLEGAMGFFGGPVQRVLTKGLARQFGDDFNKQLDSQIAEQESQIQANQNFFSTKFNQYKSANDIMAMANEANMPEVAEALTNNTFATVAADNFAKGTTESLENSIKEIAALSPEEAAKQGYSEDYVEKANTMLGELQVLEKEWNKSSAYTRPGEIFINRQNRKLVNTAYGVAEKQVSIAKNDFISAFKAYDDIDFSQEAFEKQEFVADPELNKTIVNSPQFQTYYKQQNNLKEASKVVVSLDKQYTTLTSAEQQQKDIKAAKLVKEKENKLAQEAAEKAKRDKAEAKRKAAADKAKARQTPKAPTQEELDQQEADAELEFERRASADGSETELTESMFEETAQPEVKQQPEVKVATESVEDKRKIIENAKDNELKDKKFIPVHDIDLKKGDILYGLYTNTQEVANEYTVKAFSVGGEGADQYLKGVLLVDNATKKEKWWNSRDKVTWNDLFKKGDTSEIEFRYNKLLEELDQQSKEESIANDIESAIDANNTEDTYTEDKDNEVSKEQKVIDTQVNEANQQVTSDSDGNATYEYDRIVNGFNALAYLSRAYKQIYNVAKNIFSRKDIDNAVLDSMLDKQLLNPKMYTAGTPITLELANDDTEMYDPNSTDKSKTTWGEFVSSKGLKPTDQEWIDNVPIVIKNVEGKPIAHLHTLSWINSQNVAGDIEENKKNLAAIRSQVIAKGKVETTIESKTIGKLFKTSDNKRVSVATAMPDTNLELAVGKDGKFYSNRGEKFKLSNVVNKTAISGVVYAVVPFGNEKIALPLYTKPLTGNDDIINTVTEAIRIYAKKDETNPLVNQILKELKINITTTEGISRFITMFVTDSKMSGDILVGKSNQGLISINKGSIVFGFGGDKGKFINQSTDPKFLETYLSELGKVLNSAYSNVALDRINNNSKVAFIKNGTLTTDTYLNYVKSVTETNILSVNIGTDENPEYTYFIQPVIKLNSDNIIAENNKPVVPQSPTNIEEGIQISGLDEGFQAVTFNSFDPRSNQDVMQKITDQESFVIEVDRNDGKHLLVGLRIKEGYNSKTTGRDGYVFASIKKTDRLPSNIVDVLTNKAIESISKVYPNITNATASNVKPLPVTTQQTSPTQPITPEIKPEAPIAIKDVQSFGRIEYPQTKSGNTLKRSSSTKGDSFFEVFNIQGDSAEYKFTGDVPTAVARRVLTSNAFDFTGDPDIVSDIITVSSGKLKRNSEGNWEITTPAKIISKEAALQQLESDKTSLKETETVKPKVEPKPIGKIVYFSISDNNGQFGKEVSRDESYFNVDSNGNVFLTEGSNIKRALNRLDSYLKPLFNVGNVLSADVMNGIRVTKLPIVDSNNRLVEKGELTLIPENKIEYALNDKQNKPEAAKPKYKSKKINRDSEDALITSIESIRNDLLEASENVYAEDLGAVKQGQIVSYIRGKLLNKMFLEEEVNLAKALLEIKSEYEQMLSDALDDVKIATEANETEDAEDFQELADEIQKVLDNWSLVTRLAKESVAKINGVTIDLEEDEFEEADEANQEKFDADRAFTMDGFNKLSVKIKRLFGNIENVNKEGAVVENYLNQTVYIPFDTVYNTLQSLTANLDNDFGKLMAKLEADKDKVKWLSQVIDLLKAAPTDVKNAFASNMTNHSHNMVFVMWDRDKNGKFSLKEYSANSNAIQQQLRQNWATNIRYSDLVKQLADGNVVGESEAIDAHITKLEDIEKEPTAEKITAWLNTIGIEISEEAATEILTGKVKGKSFTEHFSTSSGIFSILKTNLAELKDKSVDDSSFFSDSVIKVLARLEEGYISDLNANSFRAGNKTVYTYGSNKHLVNQMRRLKEITKTTLNGKEVFTNALMTELASTNFTGTSFWLNDCLILDSNGNKQFADNGQVVINKESAVFKNLGHAVVSLEAIKQTGQASRDNRELYKLSPVEIEVFKIAMLQAARTDQSANNERIISVTYPTTSDKTSVYLLQTVALQLGFEIDGSIDAATYDKLYDILVLPELKRISAFQGMVNKPDNKEYNKGANHFIMLPECNTIAGLFNEKGEITPDAYNETFKQEFIKVIKSYVEQLVADKLETWSNYGIGVTSGSKEDGNYKEDSFLDSKYLAKIASQVGTEGKIRAAATDMVVQYLVSNAEAFKMFIGDPAQFWKPDRNSQTIAERIEDTFNNIGKRLASDIAPGTELANSASNNYVQIYMEDAKAASKELNGRLKELLDKSDWRKYGETKDDRFDATDAQEYTTAKEHLYVLRHLGRITDEQYDAFIEKYNKQLASIKATGTINEADRFSYKELGTILQPIKPVYVGNQLESEKDFIRRIYIKSSSFPLLPELTIGLELDKLRVAMEDLEEKSGKTVRAAYKTAVKVGATTAIKVWNDDGTIVDNLNFNDAVGWTVLNRSGFRIQQDVPYDAKKDSIKEVTQASKNLFVNMQNIDGFVYRGQTYVGKDLHDEYNRLHGELYQLGVEEIKDMIVDENGLVDVKALAEFVKDEAIRRNYSISDKLLIDLDKELKFLPFSSVADKYQAVLNALVYDRVLKQKLRGKSFVLGSAQGFVGTKKEKDEFIKNTSGIIYTDSWDETKGIMPTSTNEDGSIKLAQVFIPWKFKDAQGHKLDIKQFINKDTGRIDFTKLPKEILEVFGMRIPNQGPNSQIALEIVGFLPEASGDLIIAPEDLVVQMGSDFDVDKLYTYMYNTFYYKGKFYKNYPEGAELIKQKENLQVAIDNLKGRLASLKKENSDLYDEISATVQYIKDVAKSTTGSKKRIAIDDSEEAISERLAEIRDNKSKYEDLLTELADLYYLSTVLDRAPKLAIQNKLLDIHMAVHKNPNKDVQAAIAKPLDVWELTNIAKKIVASKRDRADSKKFIGISESYQTKKFIQAVAGKAGVGVFSLDSMFNAVVQNKGLTFVGSKDNPFKLRFGHVESTGDLSRELSLDNQTYISDVIAAYQSAAVDNEKLQLLDKLNINNETFSAIKALNQLGFGEIGVWFIAQDILFDYVEELRKIKGAMGEFVSNASEIAINRLINGKYKSDAYLAYRMSAAMGVVDKSLQERFNALEEVSLADLKSMATYTKELPQDYVDKQIAILNRFIKLTALGEEISELQRGINIDSKGFGKSIIESNLREEQVLKIFGSSIRNSTKLFGDVVIVNANEIKEYQDKGYVLKRFNNNNYMIKPTTIPGMAVVHGLFTNNELWNQIFPTNTESVKQVTNEIERLFGLEDRSFNVKSESRFKIWNAVKAYIFSNPLDIYDDSELNARRKHLLLDVIKDNEIIHKSLATIVNELKKNPKLRNNAFIQRLQVRQERGSNKPLLLEYNASAKEGVDETKVYVDFLDLLVRSRELGTFNGEVYDTTKLAQELIEYSYMTGGIQEAIQFLKVIPPSYLKATGLIDYVGNINFDSGETLGIIPDTDIIPYFERVSTFTQQYVQHNPNIVKQKITDVKKQTKDRVYSDGKLLSFSLEINESTLPMFIRVEGCREPMPPIYITMYEAKSNPKTALFKFNGINYQRISNLGTFGVREFKAGVDNQQSIFNTGYTKVEPPVNKPVQAPNNIPNPTKLTVLEQYNFKESDNGKEQLSLVLAKINASGGLTGMLAKLFLDEMNRIEDFTIAYTDEAGVFGKWVGGTLYLNKDVANQISNVEFERKLLHEIVHIFTVELINPYLVKGELDTTKVTNPILRKSLVALNSALNQYRRYLKTTDPEGLANFKSKLSQVKKDKLAIKGNNITDAEISKYYAETNLKEFIAQALTDEGFQTILNSIPDENISLFNKIKKIIADIISKILGIDNKSLLYSTIKNTIDLISSEEEVEVNVVEPVSTSTITFEEEQSTGYRERTIKNASADATIAIAVDFESAGEKLTKSSVLSQGKKYIPIDFTIAWKKWTSSNLTDVLMPIVDSVVAQLNTINAKSLNIAGNGIYTLSAKNSEITQEDLDTFVFNLIENITLHPNLKTEIKSIRTGGQTGFDEAGAKAGMQLGIPTLILAPKGWKFRNINGVDISNEQQFKARFNTTKETTEPVSDNKTTEYIYSQLGNKTQSENVVLPEDLGTKYEGGWQSNLWTVIYPKFKVAHPNGIVAYRGKVGSSAIGNPFSVTDRGEDTVKQFIEWLVTGKDFGVDKILMGGVNYNLNDLRNIYLNIIKSSKGKKILYYSELGRPSHATALDYLINEYNWGDSKSTSSNKTTETYTDDEFLPQLTIDEVEDVKDIRNNVFTFDDGVEIDTGNIILTPQQKEALNAAVVAINNKAPRFVLRGYAGTGKSTIAKFIQKYLDKKYHRYKTVRYAAPLHKAVNNLKLFLMRGGVDSKAVTVAKMLNMQYIDGVFQSGPKHLIPNGGVVIIDEASMVAPQNYREIMRIAKSLNTTVIFMGDPAQLPPITKSFDPDYGKLSPALSFTESSEGYELTHIMRQSEDNPIIDIATSLRDNLTSLAEKFEFKTEINAEGKGVQIVSKYFDFLNEINKYYTTEEYKKDPTSAKVIAYTNLAVFNYNNHIKNLIGNPQPFGEGDILMGYEQFSQDPIVHNGQDYVITYSNYESREVNLPTGTLPDGQQIKPFGAISGYVVAAKRIFSPEDVELIQKEEPQLLTPVNILILNPLDPANVVALKEILKIKKFSEDKKFPWKIRQPYSQAIGEFLAFNQVPVDIIEYQGELTTLPLLKANKPELFKPDKDGNTLFSKEPDKSILSKTIDYGYAVTGHKAQGSTYKRALIDYNNMNNPKNNKPVTDNGVVYAIERNQLKYVGITRASDLDVLFVSGSNVVEDFSDNPLNMILTQDMFGEDLTGGKIDENLLPFGYESTMSLEELKRICK